MSSIESYSNLVNQYSILAIIIYMYLCIYITMDRDRANGVYDLLRKAGYSRNKAKIIALLEQVKGARLDSITKLLGINASRANQTLNYLLSQGFVQRMERKDTPGAGRSYHVYRLKTPIEEIIRAGRNRIRVYVTDDYDIDF